MTDTEIETPVIETRECKTCHKVLPLTDFDRSYNKKCVKPCYRHDCPPCLRSKRKDYFRKHHKENYVSKPRPKKYNVVVKKKNIKQKHCPGCQCGNHKLPLILDAPEEKQNL